MSKYGNMIILIGLIIIVTGVLIRFTPLARYIGKLPGDIRVEKENFRFYFPITTLVLLSIIINLLIRIFKK